MDSDPINQALITQALAMTAAENVIVAVLRTCEKPLTITSITNCARCKNDAHFASALKQLCNTGLVLHCPAHAYWLASRGPPPPRFSVKRDVT